MNIGFKSLHPFSNLVFFLAVGFISLVASHPAVLAVSLVCGFAYDVKLGGRTAAKSFFMFLMPMMLLITAVNGLFSHYGVTVLFIMRNGNNFTLEALAYGLITGVKIVCMLLWLDCFNEVVSSDKFIFIFGRISPRLALVVSMTLRFIPMFRNQLQRIEQARRGLGISGSDGKIIERLRNSIKTVSILITWILERAIDTSDSMNARGYLLHRRTSYNRYAFTAFDAAMTAFAAAIITLMIVFAGRFSAIYNPIIEISTLGAGAWILTVSFALLCLTPLIYDLWEGRLWSISKLKI